MKTAKQIETEFKAELEALIEKYNVQMTTYATLIDKFDEDWVKIETEIFIPEKPGKNELAVFTIPEKITPFTEL